MGLLKAEMLVCYIISVQGQCLTVGAQETTADYVILANLRAINDNSLLFSRLLPTG